MFETKKGVEKKKRPRSSWCGLQGKNHQPIWDKYFERGTCKMNWKTHCGDGETSCWKKNWRICFWYRRHNYRQVSFEMGIEYQLKSVVFVIIFDYFKCFFANQMVSKFYALLCERRSSWVNNSWLELKGNLGWRKFSIFQINDRVIIKKEKKFKKPRTSLRWKQSVLYILAEICTVFERTIQSDTMLGTTNPLEFLSWEKNSVATRTTFASGPQMNRF